MNVKALLEEYDLDINDVRWFLSHELAGRMLEHQDTPVDLAMWISSGRLESEMYDMEENWLSNRQEELNRGLRDEPSIRQELERVQAAKVKRPR